VWLRRRAAAYRYRRTTGRGRADCLRFVLRYDPAGDRPPWPPGGGPMTVDGDPDTIEVEVVADATRVRQGFEETARAARRLLRGN